MSNHPGVKTTVELLESIRATMRDCAEVEEKLDYEFRVKLGRERQRRDETMEEENARATAEMAAVQTAYTEAKNIAVEKHANRRAKINRARASSKESTAERIETVTGTRKYELQKALLESEKVRDAGIATTGTNFQEFGGSLVAERAALDALEQKTRASFRGYGKFVKYINQAEAKRETNTKPDEEQLIHELHDLLEKTRKDLAKFRSMPLPLLFRMLPVWLLVPLCVTPVVLQHFKIGPLTQPAAIAISVGAAVLVLALYFLGLKQGDKSAREIAEAIAHARKLDAVCVEKSEAHYHREVERIKIEFTNNTRQIDDDLKATLKQALEWRGSFREHIDAKTVRAAAENDRRHELRMDTVERNHANRMDTLQRVANARKQESERLCSEREGKLNDELARRWQELETEWNNRLRPVFQTLTAAQVEATKLFPPWSPQILEQWKPAAKFDHETKFASLNVDVDKLSDVKPKDARLVLPGPAKFDVPLLLKFPEQGSILFETSTGGRENVIESLNNIILRLLASAPPGRLGFTIVDPVGLGQNFAGAMHLADYGEQLINSRIWTQTAQIEEKLAELNEHMEKVIQMYLRNEYETIAQYNEAAGNIAERYQFLVIADFPMNFSEVAARRLLSIATSGARCGVFTLIHWDHRHPAPLNFSLDDLRKSSVCLTSKEKEIIITGKPLPGTNVVLDAPPPPDEATEFIHKVGKASRDSNRVEVPFSQVVPPEPEIWSEETTSELRVPIGRTGATKLQYLAIGKGTRQHALIAGKTGSGKSTLFHVIITNLALWCSPEQVEFYLVDFKKGVEFKCYAAKRLPHARVVAIESDREFGLSVLQRLDDELKRRGDLFRKLGVQDIAGYKREGGTEPIPRSLLLIDEFQELFVEDDKVSQGASVLLDRIVRQGRAFGIHVVLGSQTLGGAYTVARTTLGQMVIRIALQCNEADAYLIMDDSNPAPRLLTRPGEGIYNDSAGAIEGNSPFQTVWLSDEIRDEYLDKVRAQAIKSGKSYPGPIVFEGDAPADVRENADLQKLLEEDAIAKPVSPRIWLGAPNSIKGPTEAIFHRQSGNNLLIVGQREETALAMLAISLITLAAQHPVGSAEFFVFDGSPPGSTQRDFLEQAVRAIPHKITLVKNSELPDVMANLNVEMKKRIEEDHGAGAPAVFLLFNGIQRNNKLRHEEDFSFSSDDAPKNPGALLNSLLTEGSSLGFHVIVTCDTYNNVNRFFSKKAFSEFEMRVLFQMSANDSANLSDSPKAGTLGLHRALFYNEQEGYLETFRPYALPDSQWMEQATQNLKRLLV